MGRSPRGPHLPLGSLSHTSRKSLLSGKQGPAVKADRRGLEGLLPAAARRGGVRRESEAASDREHGQRSAPASTGRSPRGPHLSSGSLLQTPGKTCFPANKVLLSKLIDEDLKDYSQRLFAAAVSAAKVKPPAIVNMASDQHLHQGDGLREGLTSLRVHCCKPWEKPAFRRQGPAIQADRRGLEGLLPAAVCRGGVRRESGAAGDRERGLRSAPSSRGGGLMAARVHPVAATDLAQG